jgi:hypothetical protein
LIEENDAIDVVKVKMSYLLNVEKTKNKKLADEIELLHLSPLPGKEFINLYKQEYPEKDQDSFVTNFIDSYVPILEKNLYLAN